VFLGVIALTLGLQAIIINFLGFVFKVEGWLPEFNTMKEGGVVLLIAVVIPGQLYC
jgi:hypothetical protein